MGGHALLQGIFLNRGLNPCLFCLHLPALAGEFFTTSPIWEACHVYTYKEITFNHWKKDHPAICGNLEDISLVLYSCLCGSLKKKKQTSHCKRGILGPLWILWDSKAVIPTDFSFPSPLQSHKWLIFVFRSVFQFSISSPFFSTLCVHSVFIIEVSLTKDF